MAMKLPTIEKETGVLMCLVPWVSLKGAYEYYVFEFLYTEKFQYDGFSFVIGKDGTGYKVVKEVVTTATATKHTTKNPPSQTLVKFFVEKATMDERCMGKIISDYLEARFPTPPLWLMTTII